MSEKRDLIKLTGFDELSASVEEISGLRGAMGVYRELGNEGAFINLNDLIYTNRGIYYIFPDNTIKKVLLYQGERHFRITDKLGDNIDPSFHIYKCDIIKQQLEQRTKLFKITTRKDGKFLIRDYKFDENMKRGEETSYKKLLLCNLCFIMFSRVRRTSIPRDDFSIREFLDPGYSSLTFNYNFDEIPVGYKSNWQEIAASLKEKRNYTCDKCGVRVERLFAEKFLNIHFTTERMYTKSIDRVAMLCIKCHSEEPGHEHIKTKSEYRNFIGIQ